MPITLKIRRQTILHSPSQWVVRALKSELPGIISAHCPKPEYFRTDVDPIFQLFDSVSKIALADDDDIIEGAEIFVHEIYTSTPCSLYRTIQTNRIHPVVRSVHDTNSWSKMSPIYCGSFNKESDLLEPPFLFNVDSMEVRGMSLKSKLPPRNRESVTDPVQATENEGWSMFHDNSALGDEVGLTSDFGKLHTSTLIDGSPFHTALHINVVRAKTGNDKSTRRKRMIFFAYEMPAGTDLSNFGMAVVFDNADKDYEGHFSLIPWGGSPQKLNSDELQLGMTPLELQLPNCDSSCSVYFDLTIVNHRYRAFPFVAAQFQFHSVWMVASAEAIADLDGDDDTAKLSRGVAVFYDDLEGLHQPEDMLPLLSKLISMNFDIRQMSSDDVRCLYHALESVSRLSTIDGREDDFVGEALDVVESLLSKSKAESWAEGTASAPNDS